MCVRLLLYDKGTISVTPGSSASEIHNDTFAFALAGSDKTCEYSGMMKTVEV